MTLEEAERKRNLTSVLAEQLRLPVQVIDTYAQTDEWYTPPRAKPDARGGDPATCTRFLSPGRSRAARCSHSTKLPAPTGGQAQAGWRVAEAGDEHVRNELERAL